MFQKITNIGSILWLTIGLVIGGLAGVLYAYADQYKYEADAVSQSVLEVTASTTPILIALSNDEIEDQLESLEAAARSQLRAGIVTLNASMPWISEDQEYTVGTTLAFIANNRERLKVGQYDEPPMDHIEEILEKYE